jgi:hypothetical protein
MSKIELPRLCIACRRWLTNSLPALLADGAVPEEELSAIMVFLSEG